MKLMQRTKRLRRMPKRMSCDGQATIERFFFKGVCVIFFINRWDALLDVVRGSHVCMIR